MKCSGVADLPPILESSKLTLSADELPLEAHTHCEYKQVPPHRVRECTMASRGCTGKVSHTLWRASFLMESFTGLFLRLSRCPPSSQPLSPRERNKNDTVLWESILQCWGRKTFTNYLLPFSVEGTADQGHLWAVDPAVLGSIPSCHGRGLKHPHWIPRVPQRKAVKLVLLQGGGC